MNARRVPREKIINGNITERETQTSGFSEIKSALSTFQTNMALYEGINGIRVGSNGTAVTASITNPDNAGAFSHDIAVTSLATAQVLAFPDFTSADQSIGTGTLSFTFGTWTGGSFTSNGTTNNVTISSGNGTLEGIAASINDATIGVTASIVKEKDDSYYLMLKSTEGAANAMQISVTEDNSGDSLDQLAYTSYDASWNCRRRQCRPHHRRGGGDTRQQQRDRRHRWCDPPLNSTTSSAETVSASFDTTTALTAAQDLSPSSTTLSCCWRSKSARGTETVAGGDLAGDPLVRSMISQIRPDQ